MTAGSSLTRLPAHALAAAIRRREVSPLEAVDAYLERIEETSSLNAVVTVRGDAAREEARNAERVLMGRETPPPLLGVPFTVKDIVATAGDRTTCGSLLYRDQVTGRDASIVARLKAAGAILLGKTNTSEFALDPHTDNRVFGATLSPWGPSLTPGGSSGGESAAIAAGCSALGIGTDYGGSVRWPAHCTGICAIRPSSGLVPATGLLPSLSPLDPPPPNTSSFEGQVNVAGPLARSVQDLTLALTVMAGPDGIDPSVAPVPLGDPEAVDPRSLRCAWWEGDGATPVRSDVAALLEGVARQLQGLGLQVSHRRPPGLERANALLGRLRSLDGMWQVRRLAGEREDQLSSRLRSALEAARVGTLQERLEAGLQWDALRAEMAAFLAEYPILLLPVAAVPAFTAGAERVEVDGNDLSAWEVLAPCRAISLYGLPAAVVPCGESREGLPLGVQVVGGRFQDHVVLAAAGLLERELGGVRVPPQTPNPASPSGVTSPVPQAGERRTEPGSTW